MRTRVIVAATVLVAALAAVAPHSAVAGWCGCEKPPPPLAAVRPPFAWPANSPAAGDGGEVILFDDALLPGHPYVVIFFAVASNDLYEANEAGRRYSFAGFGLPAGGASDWPPAILAVRERDQADAGYKPQLRVRLGGMSYGPKRILVLDGETGAIVKTVDESQFTVIGREILLIPDTPHVDPETGQVSLKAEFEGHYPTGVSGVGDLDVDRWAYVAVDVSRIRGEYSLRGYVRDTSGIYDVQALVGWNAQGWRFDTLQSVIATTHAPGNAGAPDPKFFAEVVHGFCENEVTVQCDTSADCADVGGPCQRPNRSDAVIYWKHEFNAWANEHGPGGRYELDPGDPGYWHARDNPGSPAGRAHPDFDHLIVALKLKRSDRTNGEVWVPGRVSDFHVHLEAVPGPNPLVNAAAAGGGPMP
jgi:hypothetical protein